MKICDLCVPVRMALYREAERRGLCVFELLAIMK